MDREEMFLQAVHDSCEGTIKIYQDALVDLAGLDDENAIWGLTDCVHARKRALKALKDAKKKYGISYKRRK